MKASRLLILTLALAACTSSKPSGTLLQPETAKDTAPAEYKVRFTTTKGDFVVAVHRAWAPNGADRFYNLVRMGYYTDIAFFRAIKGFMVQFGISGSPEVSAKWRTATIQDDPPGQTNKQKYLTFAKGGPNSRTTQVFINFVDNPRLDAMGFPPFGEVVEGWNIVEAINTEYGEGAPAGRGPMQQRVQMEGNTYLKGEFPNLDYIKSAKID